MFLIRLKQALGSIKRNYYLLDIIDRKTAITIILNRFHYFLELSDDKKHLLNEEKHSIIKNFLLENVFQNFDFSFNPDKADHTTTNVSTIPIWVCWWQGEESMPELNKICVNSIKKYAGTHPVKIITFDNVSNYINIPSNIFDNYKNGNISPTFLSDFLRASLLHKFGGLWLDSTILVVEQIQDKYFSQEFVSIKTEMLSNASPSKYRWAGFFLGSTGNSEIFRVFRNMFIEYFNHYNKICDYLLIDYFLSILYDKNSNFKKIVDGKDVDQPHLHLLEQKLNEAYSDVVADSFRKDTSFFKLSFKIPLFDDTNDGKKTFWYSIKNGQF
ncbi:MULTISPECIES: capsular polysaccharide synthesis protein [unclassified Empedobacter]|uniref:capsular polysaccharide synthesis protein n=1 Tax=unclassified Empedobacter TaxID=2643773 RepID=UPI0025BD4DEF|nr:MULTISPECIES: capsular polysaccharide synthesis protein [unclassified Empedobacter]